jgi:hypothetical protein
MNELDLIREFRADVPEPSPAAAGRARQAWRPRHGRNRRPLPRAIALAGALAGLGIAVALLLPAQEGGRLGSPPASAAEILKRAASQVAPARPLRPGELWYTRMRTRWRSSAGPGIRFVVPAVREDWIGTGGYRAFRTRNTGRARFLGPRDRARWIAAGKPELVYGKGVGRATHRPKPGSEGARKPFYDGSRQLSYRELLDLPREPAALHARLRAAAAACECGQSVRHQTFMTAVGLLYATPIPGDLRAALLRAAALIPGIERIERIRDVAGRVGTGVTVESDVQRRVLVFDRETYEVLGEGEFPARRGGGAPRLLSGSAIMASGIVDSPNARP